MTEETLFSPVQGEQAAPSQEASIVAEAPAATPTTSIPPELAELVGEGKKYKTVADAQRSISSHLSHIQKIEQENAQYKEMIRAKEEELAKRKAAEELLQDMRKETQQAEPSSQGVEVNKDVVSEIVQQQLRQASEQAKAEANKSLVRDSFVTTYGDKAEEVYNRVANENGMTPAQLNALVINSPQAVLNLAGMKGVKPQVPGKVTSDVNLNVTSGSGNADPMSARVRPGATSKELANAWAATRAKVYKDLNIKE